MPRKYADYKVPRKRMPDVYEAIKYGRLFYGYTAKYRRNETPLIHVYQDDAGYFVSSRAFSGEPGITRVGQIYQRGAIIHGVEYITRRGLLTCPHSRLSSCERCEAWAQARKRKKTATKNHNGA